MINKLRRYFDIFVFLASPVIFFAFLVKVLPLIKMVQLDPDEGLNLSKAYMTKLGYSLFTEIWSDQPVLFSVVLRTVFNYFPETLYTARIVTVLFSVILLCALQLIVKIETKSTLIAVLASVALISTTNYLHFSRLIMIGLPALSLATCAVLSAVIITNYNRARYWWILTGVLAAAAIMTKLFAGIVLIPIFFLLIQHTGQQQGSLRSFINSGVLFTVGLVSMLMLICFTYGPYPSYQALQGSLLGGHLKAAQMIKGGHKMFAESLGPDLYLLSIFGAALIVMLYSWRTQKQNVLKLAAPASWLVAAISLFLLHKPLWYHHYLIASIPLVWLTAISLSILTTTKLPKTVSYLRWSGAVLACGWFLYSVPPSLAYKLQKVRNKGVSFNALVLATLQKYQSSTRWILTDKPSYAFLAQKPIPPELAVVSYKRVRTTKRFVDVVRRSYTQYQPEIIFFDRFKDFIIYLKPELIEHYVKVNTGTSQKLFVSKKIFQPETTHFNQEGFSTIPGYGVEKTTGGAAGEKVSVKTVKQFVAAVSDDIPRQITIENDLDLSVLANAEKGFPKEYPVGMVNVGSNKTILGKNGVTIRRGSLHIDNKSNIIIQNIMFRDLWVEDPDDLYDDYNWDFITIRNNSHHIWIDHNDFEKAYDGLIDITKGSDLVTLSWNIFKNHKKGILIGGSSDADTREQDTGKLNVTLHHNYFSNIESRSPRIRFGNAHIYNQYNENGSFGSGVASTDAAAMLIENSYFERPLRTDYLVINQMQDSAPGRISVRNSFLTEQKKAMTLSSPGSDKKHDKNFLLNAPYEKIPYPYQLNEPYAVPELVKMYAGVGKVTSAQ